MATRYDHVNRAEDSPNGGIDTWNRIGLNCQNSNQAFVSSHSEQGAHRDELVSIGAGHVIWDDDGIRVKASHGGIRWVDVSVSDRPRIVLGNMPGIAFFPIVTPLGTYDGSSASFAQIVSKNSQTSVSSPDVSIHFRENSSPYNVIRHQDFMFVVWALDRGATLAEFRHVSVAVDDALLPGTVNRIGKYCERESRSALIEHNGDGTHITPLISKGGAYINESSGTYTTGASYGIASSSNPTKNGQGDITVSLDESMKQHDDGNYYYIVLAQHRGLSSSPIYVDNLGATSFDIKNTSGSVDFECQFEVYGETA